MSFRTGRRKFRPHRGQPQQRFRREAVRHELQRRQRLWDCAFPGGSLTPTASPPQPLGLADWAEAWPEGDVTCFDPSGGGAAALRRKSGWRLPGSPDVQAMRPAPGSLVLVDLEPTHLGMNKRGNPTLPGGSGIRR